MTYPHPPVVFPSRRSRYWVHAVPAVALVAVMTIAAFAGADAFNVADSSSGTRPAAPYQAFVVWMVWLFPLTAVGTFLTLLAYLLVLPSRSHGLKVTQIVLTCIAAFFAIIASVLAIEILSTF
ncbi:hypothetical protein E3T39_12990 [Cryobacterium suzukii]|uniref:Uncharacterized protein n=1 Tax=Cryobacterium suzukii TaxID=1259198 RepID=A0A4R9ACK8_9MICO|nr:hypothetical protein [Cryobacterium suzukii]TFD57695.1 hypothetical protein E3T39_12990 [Cryobacterium suzukii]